MLHLDRLRAAAIDGRTKNPGYRQNQLAALHEGLRTRSSEVCAAMVEDGQSTSREVDAEFLLSLATVREAYEGLDFEKSLRDENLVVEGKDNTNRRVGVGVVVIRPIAHTRLYSILAPVAAALAAGNCILLELEDSPSKVDKALKELLPTFLDHDTFSISTKRTPEQELKSCTLVDQGSKIGTSSQKNILSSSTARAIAIVDRTADIEVAARAIVAARFSFQGRSPYAPDLVLVNEAIKKEFVETCIRFASPDFYVQTSSTVVESGASQDAKQAIQHAEGKQQLKTFGSSDFLLVDISDRSAPIASMKVSGRFLPLITCSSMSDAISTQQSESILLAGYFFGSPKAGKFLSQSIDCHITCINQIPAHLLLGPAAVMSNPPDLENRYTTEMFSVSRPQFTRPASGSRGQVADILGLTSESSATQRRAIAIKPLNERFQPQGKAIGFFEQGILVGMSIVISVVVPAIGYASWIGGRRIYQLLKHR